MGQKIHPVGLRLGITRTWDSRWFEKKNYVAWLHEDVAIRKYFGRMTRAAAISRVEIERRANQARVIINTGKPGIIIGKRGVGIDEIRRNLETLTGKQVQVNVIEIKTIELDARLVGQNIVDQLEKRIAFRRAMKQAIMRTMKAGARGVKVQVSGRLGGAEIARTERNHDGKVPLHTLRADIDYAHVEAFTTFGRIGVKVWIYKGEVLPDQPRGEREVQGGGRAGEAARFRDNRRGTRGGRGRGGAGDGAPRSGEAGGRAARPAPGEAGEAGAAGAPDTPEVTSESALLESAAPESPALESAAPESAAPESPALDTAGAMQVAQADGQSLESVTDGAPSIEGDKPNAPHSGADTGYRVHDVDVAESVGEVSQPDPESQHTVDEAERPGAQSSAPTAHHPEPAPGGGTHDRPELKTGPEDDNAGTGEVGR
jgi:small subunit ribosomal protein S3